MSKLSSLRRAPALGLWVAFTALCLYATSAQVDAEEARKAFFNLPKGDAVRTLKKFSAQSGEELVYPIDQVRGVKTNAVRGEYSPRDALNRMVAGTKLVLTEDAVTGAFAVYRVLPSSAGDRAMSDEDSDKDFDDLGEPVRLSPFEVREKADESYGAFESNTLTAFRLEVDQMPATVQIFTRSFMDDIGATSIEEVLTGYSGTVNASSSNASAQLDMPGDRNGAQGISIRGGSPGDIKRDGFIGPPNSARTASGYTDNFSIERVEVIEGPQSILYGSAGGGGVVNAVSKRAEFGKRKGSVRFTVDQYGSKRALIDVNNGGDHIALRLVAVASDARSIRYGLGNDLHGFYGQVALRLGPETTLRVYSEHTDNLARVSFKPNLNPFLALDDPRRDQDARYLALTGQLDDLDIIDGGINYNNLESLASWWSSERIKTQWSGLTLESRLSSSLSAQLVAIYSDTTDLRATDGRSLVPALGLSGVETNPFEQTAVRIGSPTRVNTQGDRNRGVRLTFVHTGEFTLGGVRASSKSAFGGHGFHRGPSFGSSGIAMAYYEADADWEPVINPALTTDYGRVPLESIYFPVQAGVPARPLFEPGTPRVTVGGKNYVLQPRTLADPARATPENPFGLIPNNPTAENPNGFADTWNRGSDTHSASFFAANFTEWLDGRLTTLAGFSVTRLESINIGNTIISRTPRSIQQGWQVGTTYELRPGLRAYAVMGTAEQAEASTVDLYGVPLKSPRARSPAPEFGIKFSMAENRLAMQLSVNPSTHTLNEIKNTGGTEFLDAVNPDGINGRLRGSSTNQWVNLDRSLSSESLSIVAQPTPNWRIRLLASHLDGKVSKSVVYRQLYNDEFHTRGDVVTYADGTPLLVDPAGAGGAATTPLTLSMINDPGTAFHAAPDPTSGRITNETLRAALTSLDPIHGRAATGNSGLPLDAIQYDFESPYPGGNVVIYQAGEKNTGFNEYSFNLQSNYTFSSGWLRGVGVFTDVQAYAKNRAYYSNRRVEGTGAPGLVVRELQRLPDAVHFNLGLSYRRRLGDRVEWSTRLHIRNVFDHSKVWVLPSPGNADLLRARLSAQPRLVLWTNSIRF